VSFAQVDIGGYIQTDIRMQTSGDNIFSWNENRLDLTLGANPSGDAHLFSELWLLNYGFPQVNSSSDLTDGDKISPWNLDLRETYIDLYGFLLDDLDLRIGRQRIAWGTADKLNPTDNLDPDDLRDVWDFGRHLGSDALKATYYLGDLTFTGAFIPIFKPAVLPTGDWAAALSPPMELPPGLTPGSLTGNIAIPENNIENSSVGGMKIATTILNYDLSLSYIYGRDDLPLAKSITFIPVDTLGTVDISTELVYPRMQIVGTDMAGALFSVGIWAEAAMFIPDKTVMTTDLSAMGMGVQESTMLDDPFVKYVVGADYTFKNGIYINGQYLHGFIHERGSDNIEDYFMFVMEWKLFDDKLKIAPIGGGIEIKDFKEIEDNYALIFSPEITYHPVDNADVVLGARIIDGKESTTFGKVKAGDDIYLKVKYSF
jgi:hypothetical protein